MQGFRDRFRDRPAQKETADPIPNELCRPETAPPTLREQIQTAIRSEMSLAAENAGFESFDQADDFEEDDPDHLALTAYEMVLMTPEVPETLDGAEEGPPTPPPEDPLATPGPTTTPPGKDAPEPAEEVPSGAPAESRVPT